MGVIFFIANSNGGVIILGVGERQDGSWYTTGLKNVDKLKRNFWNTIHGTKKVSINLLSEGESGKHTYRQETDAIKNKRRKQANIIDETEDNCKLIRDYLSKNGLSKTNDIATAIGLSAARTRVLLKEMSDVEYEGTNTNRKYRLADEG